MSTHEQRMANSAYAAHIRTVVAQAPPLNKEQCNQLAGIFHGAFPAVGHRKTA